jgi:hypothetical protein
MPPCTTLCLLKVSVLSFRSEVIEKLMDLKPLNNIEWFFLNLSDEAALNSVVILLYQMLKKEVLTSSTLEMNWVKNLLNICIIKENDPCGKEQAMIKQKVWCGHMEIISINHHQETRNWQILYSQMSPKATTRKNNHKLNWLLKPISSPIHLVLWKELKAA